MAEKLHEPASVPSRGVVRVGMMKLLRLIKSDVWTGIYADEIKGMIVHHYVIH